MTEQSPTPYGSFVWTSAPAAVTEELIDGETTANYVGGTGLATKYLWEEVPAGRQVVRPREPAHLLHRTACRHPGVAARARSR